MCGRSEEQHKVGKWELHEVLQSVLVVFKDRAWALTLLWTVLTLPFCNVGLHCHSFTRQ